MDKELFTIKMEDLNFKEYGKMEYIKNETNIYILIFIY